MLWPAGHPLALLTRHVCKCAPNRIKSPYDGLKVKYRAQRKDEREPGCSLPAGEGSPASRRRGFYAAVRHSSGARRSFRLHGMVCKPSPLHVRCKDRFEI